MERGIQLIGPKEVLEAVNDFKDELDELEIIEELEEE